MKTKELLLAIGIIAGTCLLLVFGAHAQGTTIIRYLRQLVGDVKLSTSPTSGQGLVFNGTVWTNDAVSSTITNAVLTNLANNPNTGYTNIIVAGSGIVLVTNGATLIVSNAMATDGFITNVVQKGFVRQTIFTNSYSTTNCTVNFTNGVKQYLTMTNNVLLAASGNVAGFSGDMDFEVQASGGTYAVFFPNRAAGWFAYGTNTAGASVSLTNGQAAKIAINHTGTNINYAIVPVNN